MAGAVEDLAAGAADGVELVDERMARIDPVATRVSWPEGPGLLRELPRPASHRVLLHGDFTPGTVLSCGDGRWAAIDPNP